jgi:phage shock protein PspC (stress-responsive transcriptional regulator)
MQTSQPSVFARDHTILGVCEALGEDLGFNPLFLRVPLAVCLLLNPTAVIVAYLAAAVLVFLTRWIAPNPSWAPAEPAAAAAPAHNTDQGEPELAIAA